MDGATFVILKSLLNNAEGDVSDILALLGTTDISSIGDGTVTGAITTLKGLIDLLPKFDIEVVPALPTTDISETTIYLVPAQETGSSDLYSEYIYVNNAWEILGVQRVDLDNYYTKTETDNLLNDKQDALTFDTVPTDESENPVTSDGIYNDIHINIAEDSTYESVKTLSNCGAFPMPSLKVSIEPIQEGSGDPSPTNVRPISGWTEEVVTRTGKNLFDKSMTLENGYIDSNGQVVISAQYKHTQLIKIKPNTAYVGSGYLSSGSGYLTTVAYYDKNQNFISQATMGAVAPYAMTTPQNANYLILSGNTPQVDTIQLEEGSTATTYEPYAGTTTTIPFTDSQGNPVEVFGGTLDVVSGVLTVDRGYIASYNGETLPSTWISDRDVYVEGTSPTTGAQVVYELATPITYQLTPTQVKSLLGTNNIWADTGDVGDVRYIVKNAASDIITAIKDICYTKTEIDSMIGDISNALDTINGEVV